LIQEKYNEQDYAIQVEKNGFLTKYHNYELMLLIKYWKQYGIKPKQRKEKLYSFCKDNIENFNEIKYFKKLNYILREGGKKDNPLIIIENIPITDNEIKYINNLNIDYNFKKILFTLLVEMKVKKEIGRLKYGEVTKYNYIRGNQNTYNEIFEVAKIPNNNYKINVIINELEQLEYIDVRTRGRIRLLFMDYIEESNVTVFDVTTFDNMGYYFDWYNGDLKIIECENCGKLIKATSNRKKYCSVCWEEKRKNDINENAKKYYHSNKDFIRLENP